MPNLQNTSSTSLLATVVASWLGIPNASNPSYEVANTYVTTSLLGF